MTTPDDRTSPDMDQNQVYTIGKETMTDRKKYHVSLLPFFIPIITIAIILCVYVGYILNINSDNVDKLNEAIANHKELIDTVAQSKKEIAALRSDKFDLERNIATLTTEHDDLKLKVEELRKEKQGIDAYYQKYQLEKDSLDQALTQGNKTLEELNENIATTRSENDKAALELKNLQAKVKANRPLAEQNNKLQNTQEQLKRKNRELEHENNKLEADIKDREQKLAALLQQEQDTTSITNQLKELIAGYEEQVNTLQASSEKLSSLTVTLVDSEHNIEHCRIQRGLKRPHERAQQHQEQPHQRHAEHHQRAKLD